MRAWTAAQEGQHTPYLKKPNARTELLPEAGAQRTLEAVSSRPLFGAGADMDEAQRFSFLFSDSRRLTPA
jgi:hypothetical protein